MFLNAFICNYMCGWCLSLKKQVIDVHVWSNFMCSEYNTDGSLVMFYSLIYLRLNSWIKGYCAKVYRISLSFYLRYWLLCLSIFVNVISSTCLCLRYVYMYHVHMLEFKIDMKCCLAKWHVIPSMLPSFGLGGPRVTLSMHW